MGYWSMIPSRLTVLQLSLVALNHFLESLGTDSIPDECENEARYDMLREMECAYFPSASPLPRDEIERLVRDSYPSKK